jgi:hypothetical protein
MTSNGASSPSTENLKKESLSGLLNADVHDGTIVVAAGRPIVRRAHR